MAISALDDDVGGDADGDDGAGDDVDDVQTPTMIAHPSFCDAANGVTTRFT